MRILVIKMSSMGDVFHTFPALSDAQAAIEGLTIDWVVEEAFAEIPQWHPAVDKVYPIALREWRKTPFNRETRDAIKTFFNGVNLTQYDLVIDAQGLLKSAWVARKINAPIAGMDWKTVREPLASLFYSFKYRVEKDQHAIWRLRELFAKSLGYELKAQQPIVYGLSTTEWQLENIIPENIRAASYLVFLHGTTWTTKYWPEDYWIELLAKVNNAGLKVVLPWGNDDEQHRALKIARTASINNVWVPEQRLSLNTMARLLKNAKGVVSVDTGLSHVAAALEVPMVVLYRVTDPKLVGADGRMVLRLESPCAQLYLKKIVSVDQEKQSLLGLSVDEVFDGVLNQIRASE